MVVDWGGSTGMSRAMQQEARPSTAEPSAAPAYHRRGSNFAVQVSRRLHTPLHHDLQAPFYADATAVPGVEGVEADEGQRPEVVRRRPLSRLTRRPR